MVVGSVAFTEVREEEKDDERTTCAEFGHTCSFLRKFGATLGGVEFAIATVEQYWQQIARKFHAGKSQRV